MKYTTPTQKIEPWEMFFPKNGVVAQKKAGRDAIVGFHMTSLKFKLQNYRSYWNLLSWCIRAAEN